MGRLVIDGSSVYEIDEECVKRRRPSRECGIYEHLKDYPEEKKRKSGQAQNGRRRG